MNNTNNLWKSRRKNRTSRNLEIFTIRMNYCFTGKEDEYITTNHDQNKSGLKLLTMKWSFLGKIFSMHHCFCCSNNAAHISQRLCVYSLVFRYTLHTYHLPIIVFTLKLCVFDAGKNISWTYTFQQARTFPAFL